MNNTETPTKENSYLDLTKCDDNKIKELSEIVGRNLLLDNSYDALIYEANQNNFDRCMFSHEILSGKTEITFSQFKAMMGGEGKAEAENEVLQVENNGWIKIESESDLPKEVDQYWFASHNNKIEIRFYNPNWIDDIVQFRRRYTHYQPIIKPEPPKF